VRIFPRGLGPKLNLSLLVFLLFLGAAMAALVLLGFRRTQSNAGATSRDGLEAESRQTLGLLAVLQAGFGQSQLEATAGLGQQAARYMLDAPTTIAPTSWDAGRLAKDAAGNTYDPAAKRISSVYVPAAVPIDDNILRDLRDSAVLDAIFPAVLAGYSGATRSTNFNAIAAYFSSVNGATRYYPAISVEQFAPNTDSRNTVASEGPAVNPQRLTHWTAPYSDKTGRGQVLTALIPVYSGDDYRGIIGLDVSLDQLALQVDSVKPTPNGFAFYLDRRGELFRTQSYDTIQAAIDSKNTDLTSVIAAMKAGEVGVGRAVINGQEVFIAYAPLGSVGGSLALVAPVSDVTQQATVVADGINRQGNRTVAVILVAMLMAFGVALGVAAWMNRRYILRPIDEIVAGTRAIAAGDLGSRIPVRSGDELGVLADSFNAMSGEVQEARESLEQRVEERTRELTALLNVSQSVASKIELGPLLAALVEQLGNVIDYYGVSVLMLRGDELFLLDVDSGIGGTVANPFTGVSFREEGAIWEAMERGEAVVISNVRDQTDEWARRYRNVMSDDAGFRAGVASWLSVPLASQDQLVGSLTIASGTVGYFTPERTRLVRGIASQVAVAIVNARLFAETEERKQELATLLDVADEASATLELAPLLDLILRHVHRVAPYDRAGFLLLEDGELVSRAVAVGEGIPMGQLGTQIGLRFRARGTDLWNAITAGEPFIVNDVRSDTQEAHWYRAAVGEYFNTVFAQIRNWMSVPVTAKDRVIGILTLSRGDAGFYAQRHGELAKAIASQAGVAIENARLFEETQQAAREMSALLDFSHAVASRLDRDGLANLVLDQLKRIIDYTGSSVVLLDGEALEIVASRSTSGASTNGLRIPVTGAASLWDPVQDLQAVIIDDVRDESSLAASYRQAIGAAFETVGFSGVRSWMAVPLAPKDAALGFLTMSRTEPGYFTDHHAKLARAVADQAAVALENARLFEESQQRTRELSVLLSVAQSVTSNIELEPLMNELARQLRTVIDCLGVTVLTREGDEVTLLDVSNTGTAFGEGQRRGDRVPAAGAIWRAMERGETVAIANVRDENDPWARRYRNAVGNQMESPPFAPVRGWLAVPLETPDRVGGMLHVSSTEVGYFTPERQALVRGIANQAAVAIENARLFEETQRSARELGALLDVSKGIAASLDLRTTSSLILDYLKTVLDYQNASISLLDGDEIGILEHRGPLSREWLDKMRGAVLRRELRPAGVTGESEPRHAVDMFGTDVMVLNDMWGDAEDALIWQRGAEASAERAGVSLDDIRWARSYMRIPITAKERLIGLISLHHEQPKFYTEHRVRLARAVADQAAVALDNARLFEETKRRGRETEALFRADEQLFQSLSLDAVFQALVDVCVDVLGVPKSTVTTLDSDNGQFTTRASRNVSQKSLDRMAAVRAALPLAERIDRLARLTSLKEPSVNNDIRSTLSELSSVFDAEGIKFTVDVPIKLTGSLRGVLSLGYTNPRPITRDELRLLQALAERAAVAIDNAELYERAQQVASLEERQKLARELHDSVSQALYGIALGARTARTLLDRDPAKAIEPVDYVLSLAEAGLTEMRALIFELRPESLENEGLVVAIEKNVAATRARYGLAVEAHLCPEPDAGLDVKEAAYRIAQEALHNIVKHAGATHVDIRLTHADAMLTLEVVDNGAGFDTGGEFPGHIGLRSMRERAAKSGGAVEIESAPGAGTRIVARLRI
jgi:GAF domain-containing protein